jgi:hypothetical protein
MGGHRPIHERNKQFHRHYVDGFATIMPGKERVLPFGPEDD